jgi:hypothetical protein
MAALVGELESHDRLPNRDVVLLGTYAFGVPTVHAAHHKWVHFAGSIVARIALPTVLGLANSVKNQEPNDRGAGWGIIGGMAAASFLDAVLSRD